MDETTRATRFSRIEARLEELARSPSDAEDHTGSKAASPAASHCCLVMLGLFGSNQVAAIGSDSACWANRVARSNVSTVATDDGRHQRREVLRSDMINRIDLPSDCDKDYETDLT